MTADPTVGADRPAETDADPGARLELGPGTGTGIGSWPGVDPMAAARSVFGELGEAPQLPFLPELPARGPGADMIGRTAALLVDLPVDLQPSGWRFVDRPGRDLQRARSFLRQDLDVLAEVADGYAGALKLQVAGPWTLASAIFLPRLERAVVDPGAVRDLLASLAEGIRQHLNEVARLVPGAPLVVQVDEPGLPAVLTGALPTASGFGRLRAVEEPVVVDGLRDVLTAAAEAGAAATALHCCGDDPPVELLARTGAGAVGLDLGTLRTAGWEQVATALDAGLRLWAGALPTRGLPAGGRPPGADAVADAVSTPWRTLGLDAAGLADVVVTPACGLAAATPAAAVAALRTVRQAAGILAERSAD